MPRGLTLPPDLNVRQLLQQAPMHIARSTQKEVWPHRDQYHVLTYAEEGFSPLNIHARNTGANKGHLVAFAKHVNQLLETGSLHPLAPISAVPRTFVRDMNDVNALRDQIIEFLRANATAIKATKLICDFRTPSVPRFVIAAIEEAMSSTEASILKEVIIILE
jgi:hypothetical protein